MESIKIETGEIRLCVNGDENRIISFNPSDWLFAEKFYSVMGEFERKMEEFQQKARDLGDVDEGETNIDWGPRLALLRELCDLMRGKIDELFGAGTAQKAFGDAMNLSMFGQFFDGITPYFKETRAKKIAPYLTSQKPSPGKRRKSRKR